jgi:hypothetical protein
MKIAICTSPLSTASKTRGVGVYTRELISAFHTRFPADQFIETRGTIKHHRSCAYPFLTAYALPWRYLWPTIITIHVLSLKYPPILKQVFLVDSNG